jgi:AcrR family transcriptional regulator
LGAGKGHRSPRVSYDLTEVDRRGGGTGICAQEHACRLHVSGTVVAQERAIVKTPNPEDRVPESSAPTSRPARTQAERTARTRGALIDAARALFAERGYAGAGREEIVERAGVTRGAMYHHFASKDALFIAVYEVVERELLDAIAASAMQASDPVEMLRLGALAFLDAAATPEVRRISLLDAPAVIPVETRRALSEQYGLGMVLETLRSIDVEGRLLVHPVDALAPVLLAALHEAATAVADGADVESMRAVVLQLIDRVTSSA